MCETSNEVDGLKPSFTKLMPKFPVVEIFLGSLHHSLFTILACFSLAHVKFVNPVQKDFLYFHLYRLWNKQILRAVLKVLVQGFLVTAPAMLIMK